MTTVGFFALSAGMLLTMLAVFLKFGGARSARNWGFAALGWLGWLVALDATGVVHDFGFPPRMVLLVVVPAVVMMLVAVNRTSAKRWLEQLPWHIPVLLQAFRIVVELLIYATYREDIFPQRATFEGLNFDILVGISALPVGWAVYKGLLQRKGLLAWNFASLGVLSLTVYSFLSVYFFTDFATIGEHWKLVTMPYLLLP
ncbi:MAG: hypothetical protein AAGB22_06985, partial [Bacteroidota bacterium]